MTRTLFILGLLLSALALANTPAGTVIRNQARAVVGDAIYLSNEVDISVRAVCSPSLTPDGSEASPGQRVGVGAGSFAYVPYLLTNAGNDRFTFDLGVALGAGDWNPVSTTLYRDLDGNGRLDTGESAVTSVTLDTDEQVALVLEVATPASEPGDRYVSPTATCQGGGPSDAGNTALVQIVRGPALQLFKSVSGREFGPGDVVEFEVRVQNTGSEDAEEPVVVTDDFDLSDLGGLTYISGSASASRGVLEYDDGTSWRTTEPNAVRGVRLSLPSLAVNGEATLSFRMRVSDAEPGPRENRASADLDSGNPGGPVTVSAGFRVTAFYGLFLGPEGKPRAQPGGEGSADDTQALDRLILGQTRCFAHTLENASTATDRFTIDLGDLPAGVTATFVSADDEPLLRTVTLQPGEDFDFRLCLTPDRVVPPFRVTLTATSAATGQTNLTYDRVDAVVAAGNALTLVKTAEPEDAVGEDEPLRYTLTVTNEHDFDLNNVVVSDTLQGFENADGELTDMLEPPAFVSASDGGTYDPATRTVTWRAPRLASGEQLSFTLELRTPADVPPDMLFRLRNRFEVRAQELPRPARSNEVVHAFPRLTLSIEKTVEEEVVRIGDVLHYTLTVANPNDVALRVIVVDTPPARTQYVAESAVVSSGPNERALETEQRPVEENNGSDSEEDGPGDTLLIWNLTDDPDFYLAPAGDPDGRDRVSIRYALTVLPGARSPLQNVAYAVGAPLDGPEPNLGIGTLADPPTPLQLGDRAFVVASAEVQVEVIIEDEVFAQPEAFLSGRVYLDADADRRYDPEDLPLPGARVLLPNGWQTLTDAEGRYTFRGLTAGSWSVTLDARSAPFAPLPHPEGLREGYTHRVVLQGLTVSDFPLVAPAGVIQATRQTTVQLGPLTVEKRLIALPGEAGPGGVRVVLTLASGEPLPELVVRDPVPDDAPRVFTFERFQGEETLTYDLEGPVTLTDPDITWRYP